MISKCPYYYINDYIQSVFMAYVSHFYVWTYSAHQATVHSTCALSEIWLHFISCVYFISLSDPSCEEETNFLWSDAVVRTIEKCSAFFLFYFSIVLFILLFSSLFLFCFFGLRDSYEVRLTLILLSLLFPCFFSSIVFLFPLLFYFSSFSLFFS